jgi:hypothetical protein
MMIDVAPYKNWPIVEARKDFPRNVRIEVLKHPDAPPEPNTDQTDWLRRGGWAQALLLWREAGSSLPMILNIGAMVRIAELVPTGGQAALNVHRVFVQIRKPDGPGDQGQVSEGFYIVEGATLIMTRGDGTPVDDRLHRHELRDGDNADAIAQVLTRKIRRQKLGLTDDGPDGFNRPLRYGSQSVA